jgi:C-terminal processing protease CtpA/Prc
MANIKIWIGYVDMPEMYSTATEELNFLYDQLNESED